MASAKSNIAPGRVKSYKQLVEQLPGQEVKGATMPYTSINGNMFSFLDKEGRLSLRLAPDDRDAFIAKHRANLSTQHGTVLKEYVLVPDSVFSDPAAMKKYFRRSLDYAAGLKSKKRK